MVHKRKSKKLSKQAIDSKTRAAAMAHATHGRKTSFDSKKQYRINKIRKDEMKQEIKENS